MKWIYLALIVLLAPALAGLLRSNKRYLAPTCFVLGFATLLLAPILWTAPIGWAYWPSPVRGTEITFVDAVAIALITATRPVRIPLSYKAN